jgi:predicted DNA-binding protein
MKKYVNTYRITISEEMKLKLKELAKYKIRPTAFIRLAIEEKFEKELSFIRVKKEKINLPF